MKRVIGLPGETVTACGDTADLANKVCINGRELKESYLPDGTVTDMTQIAGTKKYGCAADSPVNGCTVLPGHYFVMGDNRARSSDARAHGPIKGRASWAASSCASGRSTASASCSSRQSLHSATVATMRSTWSQ